MYLPDTAEFCQTVRRDQNTTTGLRPEGTNLRYAAIVVLGLTGRNESDQRAVLGGKTAADLARIVAERGAQSADLGATALAGWAAAEVCGVADAAVLDRLINIVAEATPQPTVDYAWTLTALLAARRLIGSDKPDLNPASLDGVSLAPTRANAVVLDGATLDAAISQAVERLLDAQAPNGLFPHALPCEVLGRFRKHVGCFADQVYPIQALARHFAATGDDRALQAANRCAARIVQLQGPAGQWWWHYDVRTGQVVEGFPVYSVHQHAMAPMALFDLFEAGGTDHRAAIASGLSWLKTHPESTGELISTQTGAVWRKVGRREPRKAVRSIRAVTTSLSPRLRIRALDRIFAPGVVDHECRPYELGWLLYAWKEH
jgi:hypothetical protein